ncbi:MAG TPA: enoyl-CoA hydratase/isomerase family protein [Candidatus Poseidoniales archaeon]|jgi:enoyl-CoA hydratase|nr:enoyl-CoA hydratase/isomerase family protein [Candidatus Poseidoniaceae archaeon]DAC39359.1 MAG TPA: enoyl-CoA hydratase/isomerase family protein [Candidatus Poseidoniales archaeon]HIH57670.1 enoyl-CoA hydratase/isomerase family protein [Candidatus Poseidoniaceae archaeon]|tara:strand:- start:38 stop:862 length:825 start_codon:yes stop_codon:yes gene_type:complete
MSEVLVIEEIPCENGDGMIAKVTINRPDKLNALNQDVTSSIKEMCKWADENDSIRCVVITGAKPNPPPEGKRAKPNAFVAGADITEFVGKGSQEIREMFRDNAIEAIWNLKKPTIAMVDGFALGGGCEVACSCDIRIASDRSIFGTPEIKLGLIPGYGGSQRLVHLVGYGRAMEMMMTGNNVSAEDAYRMGIVNHLCTPENLEEKTMEIAQTIASKSMHTLRIAKQTIRASLDNGITDGVEIEAIAFANLFDTEDKEIGVQAFLNRSEPKWVHK